MTLLDGVIPYPPEFVARYRALGFWEDRSLACFFDEICQQFSDRVEAQESTQKEQECIDRYRAETRATRVQVGRELSLRYGYDVSWGMRLNKTTQFFTSNMKPVMTRLSVDERRVVDLLIAANIAHTRSAALGYIVRVFATEHQEWLEALQHALVHIEQVRNQFQPQPRKEPPTLRSAEPAGEDEPV